MGSVMGFLYYCYGPPITAMGVGHTVEQGHLKEKVLWLQKIEGGSMDPPGSTGPESNF